MFTRLLFRSQKVKRNGNKCAFISYVVRVERVVRACHFCRTSFLLSFHFHRKSPIDPKDSMKTTEYRQTAYVAPCVSPYVCRSVGVCLPVNSRPWVSVCVCPPARISLYVRRCEPTYIVSSGPISEISS